MSQSPCPPPPKLRRGVIFLWNRQCGAHSPEDHGGKKDPFPNFVFPLSPLLLLIFFPLDATLLSPVAC
ncbi:hypothetical protein JOB18_049189 [Solea senegalensis]|uniref:Uncharacterized protein n=1 Tax=Solea senegalensis TaxID=28829 RepID=A0AAV6TD19_SOLSE|nr:hypothetical protein JOB18_049189 [Solea senegalensis]